MHAPTMHPKDVGQRFSRLRNSAKSQKALFSKVKACKRIHTLLKSFDAFAEKPCQTFTNHDGTLPTVLGHVECFLANKLTLHNARHIVGQVMVTFLAFCTMLGFPGILLIICDGGNRGGARTLGADCATWKQRQLY